MMVAENSARLTRQIDFILNADRLKMIERYNFLLQGERRENAAEHSWHLALMSMLLQEHANEAFDLAHVLQMLLVHDLVEIEAGDTFAYDQQGIKMQMAREEAAMAQMLESLPQVQGHEISSLWYEFDAGETPEARFAMAMDRLMPLLHNFYTQGKTWQQNSIHKQQVLERIERIRAGSETLYQLALSLVNEAVVHGYLKE